MNNPEDNRRVPFFVQVLLESLNSLRSLGRRTLLALLGIVVGCATVIALLNIGYNAANESLKTFKGMGSNTLTASFPPSSGSYRPAPRRLETKALSAAIPIIEHVAPLILYSSYISLNGRGTQATIAGTSSDLADVLDLRLEQGRFLSSYDKNSTYAVIGARVARDLAPIKLGDHLPVEGYLFEVVGIATSIAQNPLIPVTANDSIFVPIEGMRRLGSGSEIGSVIARTRDTAQLNVAAEALKSYLDSISPGRPSEVQVPQQLLDGLKRQANTFSYLLAGLGGISLLVGSVGVMNVMLMNVTERRREIGIRIALGAKSRDIRNLFLMEAATLSIAGSVLGACFGLTIAYFFTRFSGWSFDLDPLSLPLGIGSSLIIGLFFGLYPALSAARLQPVQALRDD